MTAHEKTISVPLYHYWALAVIGLQTLMYYADKSDRTPEDNTEYARLTRWEQWHVAADERGLTR